MPALVRAAVVAAAIVSAATAARAGEVADKAAEAETLLRSGQTNAAFEALDAAVDGFWETAPLIIHDAAFAAEGGNRVTANRSAMRPLRSGERVTILLEPLGYRFAESDGSFQIALKTGIEIRSPGGLILAKTDDFGHLEWSGPVKNRSFTGRVGVELPKLKPGNYEIRLTLTDENSNNSATATLPFEVSAE
jgi:hypothetical protein